MSSRPAWRDALQKAANCRNIEQSTVDAILRDVQHDSQIAHWVDQNVIQLKPLTAEELTIWNVLGGTGTKSHQDIGGPTPNLAPLTEDALEEATRELELSTKSVQAKAHALRSQRDLLSTWAAPRHARATPDTTNPFESVLGKSEAAQSQQLTFINRDLVLELEGKIQLLCDGVDRHQKAVGSMVTEKLRTDDRVLDTLERALAKASFKIENSTSISDKINTLTAALRCITVKWLKARLDRVYLEELISSDSPGDDVDSAPDNAQLKQIEDDLQSLYAEIEDVASMLMENEYGDELKTWEREASFQIAEAKVGDIRETSSRLESAATSLDTLAQQYEFLQAHRQIVAHLVRSLSRTKTHSTASDGFSRPARIIRHSSTGQNDEGTPQLDHLNALLRRMNVVIIPKNLADGSATRAALRRHSTVLTRGNHDLVQSLDTITRKPATASQTRLGRLAPGELNDHFERAARQIEELDEQIAAARNAVNQEAETTYQGVVYKEGRIGLARRFAETQC